MRYLYEHWPSAIYLFQVNYLQTNLTFKVNNKDQGRLWCRSAIFSVNLEQISYIALMFLLPSLNR